MQFFTALIAAAALAQSALAAPAPSNPAVPALFKRGGPPQVCHASPQHHEECQTYMQERYAEVEVDVARITEIHEKIVAIIPRHGHKHFHLWVDIQVGWEKFFKGISAWLHHSGKKIERFFIKLEWKTRHACHKAHREIIHEFKKIREEIDLALDKCHNDVRLQLIALTAEIDIHLHRLEVHLSEGLRVRYLLVTEIDETTITHVHAKEEICEEAECGVVDTFQ